LHCAADTVLFEMRGNDAYFSIKTPIE